MNNEGTTLATEIFHELKLSVRRWFIIAICELFLILAMVTGFVWYISLPVDDVTVENDDGNANYIGDDLNGVLNNGENQKDKESNEK